MDFSNLEVTLGSVDEDGNGGAWGISVGRTYTGLQLTRITEVGGGQRSVTPPHQDVFDEGGQILGGHEFVAFPSMTFDGHQNPQAMISAKVTLTPALGTPIVLPTRFIPGNVNFDQVAVTVPDMSGRAALAFDFVWADPCFRYEGSHALDVEVVPLSATNGCVLESPEYFDQVRELLRASIKVGSVVPDAFSPMNTGKFSLVQNEGIDAIILYAFDPAQAALKASPGAVLRVERVSPDLVLADQMQLRVWTRASVAKAVKSYPPEGAVLTLSRTPAKQADGSFKLRVPEAPGRYVATVELTYDSRCSSGTLWFVVNIDVE